MRNYDATQITIAASLDKRESWLAKVTKVGAPGSPVYWGTKDYTYDGQAYVAKIDPNKFSGPKFNRPKPESGLTPPNTFNFEVPDNSLTASDYIDATVLLKCVVADGAGNEEIMITATFNVQNCQKNYGVLQFTCVDILQKFMEGTWPNTELIANIYPSTNPMPDDNVCVPVLFGTPYIPLRTVMIEADTANYYVMGPSGKTYTVYEGRSPREYPTQSVWERGSTTGDHDGGNNEATLSDSSAPFVEDALIGTVIVNETDGSFGVVTDNTTTTVTATLQGGADNDWDTGDTYRADGYAFKQYTKGSYRVVQARVLNGENILFGSGEYNLDMPIKLARQDTMYINGSQTGTATATDGTGVTLTYSGDQLPTDSVKGAYLINRTVGAYGLITANSGVAKTITCADGLTKVSDGNPAGWTSGNNYTIGGPASVIKFVISDENEGMGMVSYPEVAAGGSTDEIDHDRFGEAENKFAGWGLQWDGAFYFQEERKSIISSMLLQCGGYFTIGEKLQLRTFSGSSVANVTNARQKTFKFTQLIKKMSDSAYVGLVISGEPQDIVHKYESTAKGDYDNRSDDVIKMPYVLDTVDAQCLASMAYQKKFLKDSNISVSSIATQLALEPNDIVTVVNPLYGDGSIANVLIDSIQIEHNLDMQIKAYGMSTTMDDDFSDFSFAAVNWEDASTNTDPTMQSIAVGPNTTVTSGDLPNALKGILRVGETSNYIELDPSDPIITLHEGSTDRLKIGMLSSNNYGLMVNNSTGDMIVQIDSNQSKLAGWDLTTDTIKSDSGTVGMSIAGVGASGWRFWAGDATPGSAEFRVNALGELYATEATITGSITATSGTIGGFTVNPTDGLYAGTGATRVQMKPGAGIWTGATAIGSAPFSVTNAGVLTAESGTIGGWILAATTLTGTGVTLSSTGDAYIAIGTTPPTAPATGTGIFINKTGLFGLSANTQNFIIDATNGNITANAGTIGAFTINTHLYTGSKTAYNDANAGVHIGSDGIGLGTGSFTVSAAGVLTATGVTITGVLQAATGYIGGASGWIITTGKITSTGIGLATAAGDATYAFWAGDNTPASAEFNVTHAGVLTASGVVISGAITAESGEIGGWDINGTSIYTGTEDHSGYTTNSGDITLYSNGSDASIHAYNWYIDTSGQIVAKAGTIGGWTLAATTLTSSNIALDAGNDKITVNTITIDGTNDRIRSGNYATGSNGSGFTLGPDLLEVGNIAARGIIRTAVFQKDVISAVGGTVLIRPSDVLSTDMTSADTSEDSLLLETGDALLTETGDTLVLEYSVLVIEGNESFVVGDILRIKEESDDEWFIITDISAAPTYQVIRDISDDYAKDSKPAWKRGATVVNYGASEKGGIVLTSSETNAPYMQLFTHSGSPWDGIDTRMRVGNLNGSYGQTSDTYGVGMGIYGEDISLLVDSNNGIRFFDASSVVQAQLTGTTWTLGNISTEHISISSAAVQFKDGSTTLANFGATVTIGEVAASKGNVYIDSGAIELRVNTTPTMTLETTGELTLHSGKNLTVEAGGDITLIGAASNPASIIFDPPSGASIELSTNENGNWLYMTESLMIYKSLKVSGAGEGQGYSSLGYTMQSGRSQSPSLSLISGVSGSFVEDDRDAIIAIEAGHDTDYDAEIWFRTDATSTTKFTIGVDGADNKFKIFSGEGIGDTSEFVIDSSGNIGIGNPVPGRQFEISAISDEAQIEISTFSATDSHQSALIFQKSSATTVNQMLPTAAGEALGALAVKGVNTSNGEDYAAGIFFHGDAAPDADAVPGKISFWTSDASSLQNRMTIDDSGNIGIGIGTASPDKRLSVVGDIIIGQGVSSGKTELYIGEEDASDKSLIFEYDHDNNLAHLRINGDAAPLGLTVANGGFVGIGATARPAGTTGNLLVMDNGGIDLMPNDAWFTGAYSMWQVGQATISGSTTQAAGGLVAFTNNCYSAGPGGWKYDSRSANDEASAIVMTNGAIYHRVTASAGAADAALTFLEGLTIGSDASITMLAVYSDTVGVTNRDLYIDNTGKIGYVSSTYKAKMNANALTDVSWFHDLAPVEYERRKIEIIDGKKVYTNISMGAREMGLFAEEVELIKPELVYHDENGIPESVDYKGFITPLIVEVQKLEKTKEDKIISQEKYDSLLVKINSLKNEIAELKSL
jgi:hypothetical protein